MHRSSTYVYRQYQDYNKRQQRQSKQQQQQQLERAENEEKRYEQSFSSIKISVHPWGPDNRNMELAGGKMDPKPCPSYCRL